MRNVDLISKDDIRQQGIKSEKKVIETRDKLIEESLRKGHSVIVADTNLNPVHEEHIREKFSDKAIIEIKQFDTPIDECIRRDTLRSRPVGVRIIMCMYNRYIKRK